MIYVWTDGSCMQGQWKSAKIEPGLTSGAWAAVIDEIPGATVELTGRVVGTTNTAMEMLAAIKGLQAIPGGRDYVSDRVVLFTDCSTVRHVHWLWSRGEVPSLRKLRPMGRADWRTLAGEFERLNPSCVQVGKGSVNWHRRQFHRAHRAAKREAKSAFHLTDT